uniref:Uncharacterized protein n=1 Tax=uncultured prokaryote TaxID=198431 RepID=A0A0H5Q738_9ZZZZ|nr:hypothetical protein [uncultured prokaryote]
MKETLFKLLDWAKSQPFVGRILLVLCLVVLLVQLLFFSSCSVSQNVVTGDHSNGSAGSSVTVQIDSTSMTPTFNY